MSKTQHTEQTHEAESVLDRQERRLREQLQRIANQAGLVDAFTDFLQLAKPEDITRLFCALSEYDSGSRLVASAEPALAAVEDPSDETDTGASTNTPGEPPEWATETPDEVEYRLDMFYQGEDLQSVELTRAEFIELKSHLAKMRGLTPEVSNA